MSEVYFLFTSLVLMLPHSSKNYSPTSYHFCNDSFAGRFLSINPMVNRSNPSSAKLHQGGGESPALCHFRHRYHVVWSHKEEEVRNIPVCIKNSQFLQIYFRKSLKYAIGKYSEI